MKRIYGITGRKGHGKDTLAKLIQKHDPEFTILHFADDLKTMARAIWRLSYDQMNDPVEKERGFKYGIDMDMYVKEMSDVAGLPIKSRGIIASSPRQLLQYFGTDYVRVLDDGYWVNRVLKKAESLGKVLIPDTRFPNEAVALNEIGGKVIRVVRTDLANDGNSGHVSETAIDSIKPFVEFKFRSSESELKRMNVIAEFIAKGGLEINDFNEVFKNDDVAEA